jgi:hypothetical protein
MALPGEMAMNDDKIIWEPQILAAQAFSATRFAVAFGVLEYDDPFSIVLEYDEAFPQPWARTNISREIWAIAPWHSGRDAPMRSVALSNEGDVYFIGDEIDREKILGAGIGSPDATGAGDVTGFANFDGVLFASGQGEQCFRRSGPSRWDKLAVGVKAEPNRKPINFRRIAGSSERDIYLLGIAAPLMPELDKETRQKLLETDDWDAWNNAHDDLATRSGAAGLVDEGRVYHWDGANWRKLDLPGTSVFYDAYVETPEKVWLVGTDGAVLLGNARGSFQRVSSLGTTETLLSFTKLGETYYAASDYALHTFDGRDLQPFRPRLRRAPPTPFKVQAIDDVLFYFDYKQGVHRFKGTAWERISIPPELLTRDFKGLNRTP